MVNKAVLGILGIIVATAAVYGFISAGLLPGAGTTKPAVVINVIGGEISPTRFSYAIEGQPLTSPGPTIKVKKGDVVQINFKNVGGAQDQPHTFVVVSNGEKVLFSAKVGTRTEPLDVGKAGTTTFVADQAGEYFYVCDVPGHRRLGMWGKFIVEPQ